MQDHRSLKEPTRLFESMVVVGLHPNCDIQALERQYIARKSEGSGKLRSAISYQTRVEANIEPQVGIFDAKMRSLFAFWFEKVFRVIGYEYICFYFQVLFVYPPEKQLPLKYKDLLSFCFPGGLEVGSLLDGSFSLYLFLLLVCFL